MRVTRVEKASREGERGSAMVESTIGIVMLLGVMLMVLQMILVFHATLAAHSAATRAARAYALRGGPAGLAEARSVYNAQKATGLGTLVWEDPVCTYTSTLATCTARVRVPSIMPGAGTMFGGGGISGPVIVTETGQYPVIDIGG